MTLIGKSDLNVYPVSLGGNVFGWTADKDESFAVLDRFFELGGNFVDTADAYSAWVPGNSGGESETIIGQWLASRKPSNAIIATKVSQHPEFPGLSAPNVRKAAEASLQRLGVDSIDLYYAHFDDASVPLEETVAAFGDLARDGLIRHIAVSNYTPERIEEWLNISHGVGAPLPVAIQPRYNLLHRIEVESTLLPLAERHEISLVPYSGLASGFLTGKYRSQDSTGDGSPRATGAAKYADAKGLAILDALERIGAEHNSSIAATALAWLRQQSMVAAPIASASKVGQVEDIVRSVMFNLTPAQLAELDAVSA